MIKKIFEIAKKNILEMNYEKADVLIYDLVRDKKITFKQFKELCELNGGV